MSIKKDGKSIVLRPFCIGILAFLGLGAWAAADGPVADFPSFTSFSIAKTGDVAIDKVGNVYVNVTEATNPGPTKIWKFSPSGEGPFVVASLGVGTAFGLAVDPKGDLYAAIRTGTYSAIYRVDRNGSAFLIPRSDQIVWANALAFDQRGNLYVTETYSLASPSGFGQGGIWRIPPGGAAELWVRDPLLTGAGAAPIGANGIGYYHGNLYVVNSNTKNIVQVPIRPDGSPGQPDVWAVLQEVPESPQAIRNALPLTGDGIALDVHGNLYITVVTRASIVRIDAEDFSQDTVATFFAAPSDPIFAPLDTPNTIGFGTGMGGRQTVFVTNMGQMKAALGPPWAGAGIVKIAAGVPGLPLP